ncbi:hypothetical protein SLEP1_g27714 [Rubroshorea leprosula]|uniref:Uncharacterized protein n=1 Tax=Rubroshorea leprosula TaxID=152421 RepID=A0AAV5K101_9ROSI|nr:hypothetical protein SLEP1_g27714 [Rubroshorea leprosula]
MTVGFHRTQRLGSMEPKSWVPGFFQEPKRSVRWNLSLGFLQESRRWVPSRIQALGSLEPRHWVPSRTQELGLKLNPEFFPPAEKSRFYSALFLPSAAPALLGRIGLVSGRPVSFPYRFPPASPSLQLRFLLAEILVSDCSVSLVLRLSPRFMRVSHVIRVLASGRFINASTC